LLVRPTAYPHITHLSDVNISSPTSGNTLIYDAVQGRWENANISAGTGISVTNGAGSISIDNTGVTSVTGTAPISSSGGATPAISISQATTSVSGYLTSTDWNTFNGKYSTGGALGTPSSGTLTNCTGYTYANLSGTVPTWNQNTTGSSGSIDVSGGWAVTPSGTTLYFAYNGTNKAKLDSSGNLTVIGNVTAYGTM
jgi:hypothetical protein